MKPEIRVKLLTEYERIKTKSEPGPIWWNIIALIFPTVIFVRTIVAATDNPNKDFLWVRVILSSLMILASIWQTILVVKKIYDKKILLLLQAVLDLSEEKIYNEINNLDLQLHEKENDDSGKN